MLPGWCCQAAESPALTPALCVGRKWCYELVSRRLAQCCELPSLSQLWQVSVEYHSGHSEESDPQEETFSSNSRCLRTSPKHVLLPYQAFVEGARLCPVKISLGRFPRPWPLSRAKGNLSPPHSPAARPMAAEAAEPQEAGGGSQGLSSGLAMSLLGWHSPPGPDRKRELVGIWACV